MSGPILGIDIGGTKLALGLATPDGTLLAEARRPSAAEDGPEAVIGRILELARGVVEEAGIGLEAVERIGIGCGGPLDLHLALEVEPRVLLAFEDVVAGLPEDEDPTDDFQFPLIFTWALPPLPTGPDLLLLATELAGVGGPDLPLEVSAIDSFASVTDAAERSLTFVARLEVGLDKIFRGQEQLCDVLDRCHDVGMFLGAEATAWLDEG